ncbi:hypothetical protein F4780DRAFT_26136 [Xylariomycetidae sp. FL0641]|nr:hypothetical protein F4780DRAFT_26136 [Xylariomycetidae sp. FL0641]
MRFDVTQKQLLGAWLLRDAYKAPQAVLQMGDGSSTASVKVSGNVPSDASGVIDPDFPGLAFEQSSFVRYAQDDDGNVNEFSANLMDAIYSRTGGHPIIRLGGTSPDYGLYLPGQEAPTLPVAEQDNYQDVGHTTIGASYWPLTHNFPDATYMVQVPLANRNISEPIAWAQAAVDGIGLDKIHSIQVGNEPNAYSETYTGEGGIPLQPPEWQGTLGNRTYVGNWTRYVAAIKAAVPELPDTRFYTAFDVGSHFGANVEEEQWYYDVETCFHLGIDDGDVIKEVTHHYYQGQAGDASTLGSSLMPMPITHTHLDQYLVRIDFLRENHPDIPFVLNEVGNSLSVTNVYAYQAVLGSALWQVDFYLYAMTIGVARVNWQQIMHSGFDLWLPVASAGLPAQVFANYYSQPFVGDFLGSSGNARVARLPGLGDPDSNVAAYAAYEGDDLKRIAVVNLNYWNATSSGRERGARAIDFELGDAGLRDGDTVKVYHLNAPGGAGAGADDITYGGSQWTYESLGKEVKGVREDTEEITVQDGVAHVEVAESEAVLIWL